jgi:hypothetical protein
MQSAGSGRLAHGGAAVNVQVDEGAAQVALVDWSDLAGLDQVQKIYWLGDNTVVVRLCDSRELRITAWLDMSTGQYVSDYERRTALPSGSRTLHVWAKTPAYTAISAPDAQSCLEAAVLEVDRRHVF